MDRWWIYNLLKSETVTVRDILKLSESNETEVKEGIIEYLMMKARTKQNNTIPDNLKHQMAQIGNINQVDTIEDRKQLKHSG